ncbi:family 78 glycoside hydrolase catalytic domain [Halalkalibacter akibai]|uniref:alpha-L-rhamnosidase n=1 Tax=Halalkalibacter akibai (strain ATCC 43226 / DSM 21942 / CIP 109018 / JCM 9157 / 1139) TaxID=1236973 RepID=W4QV86_HALA3|nr:family 78 glycoside hydrolase catalytic domain [Halalkalibacter akibai]GAE35996.1 alfa-L-rhamnosidase [Halalkalibacter akibai JCM 9157]
MNTKEVTEKGIIRIHNLKVEYAYNPIGVDAEKPRFSWMMSSDSNGQRQIAYQILVASSPEKLVMNEADLWDSGKVVSDISVAIKYLGNTLEPSTKYYWTVLVWNQDDKLVQTKESVYFETGLKSTDGVTGWSGAKWISMDGKDPNSHGAPLLRKETKLNGKVKSARLYISALGVYDAYINGQKIGTVNEGDDSLTVEFMPPGWTNYDSTINYMTYDVTRYMKGDAVTLAAVLGNGWWNCRISKGREIDGLTNYYSGEVNELALFAKLLITYEDDSVDSVVTDVHSGWKATDNGPIRSNDIYDGETYDATMEIEGWNDIRFDDSKWNDVKEHDYTKVFPNATVTAFNGDTAKIIDELDQFPQTITYYEDVINQDASKNGRGTIEIDSSRTILDSQRAKECNVTISENETVIFDLGQNMVGIPRITVQGEKGSQIKLRFAEMLNDDSEGADGPKGSIYTANLRSAKATDYYTLKGDLEGETYQPTLTFHGFRYVEATVVSPNTTIYVNSLIGKVTMSALEETGSIVTSQQDINNLFSNILWGHRGNYLWIPTDCPQRDERVGWSGDTQLFANTALYNMDAAIFLENWMEMLTDSQEAYGEGTFHSSTPSGRFADFMGVVGNGGWADAGVVVPWTVWQMTGDTTIIENNYKAMVKYMDWIYSQTGETFRGPGSIGDWLNFEGTAKELLSDAYYAYDAKLMEKMSIAIGKQEEAEKYGKLFEKIKKEYIKNYIEIDNNGILTLKCTKGSPFMMPNFYSSADVEDNSQCGLLWTIKLELYENEDQKQQMVELLVENIKNNTEYKQKHPNSNRVNYAENTLSVGFLGVNVIAPILSEVGHSEVAYSLLLQDQMPSWLYSVKNGATTVWERWNSYSIEEGFGDVAMNSFNHYAYGAIAEWMYKYAAGISNDEAQPGFKHINLQPNIDKYKRLTSVSGEYKSVYGTIKSEWNMKGDTLTYHVSIPANTTATVWLPTTNKNTVKVDGHLIQKHNEVNVVGYEDGKAICQIGSGCYEFESTIENVKVIN